MPIMNCHPRFVLVKYTLISAALLRAGVHNYDSAYEMASVADTVIVGDALHEVGIKTVEETNRGATDSQHQS